MILAMFRKKKKIDPEGWSRTEEMQALEKEGNPLHLDRTWWHQNLVCICTAQEHAQNHSTERSGLY